MNKKLILLIESGGNGHSTKVTDVETGAMLPVTQIEIKIGPKEVSGEVQIRLSRAPMRIIGVYQLVCAYDEASGREVPLDKL
jgi:hypothetical protein